MEWSKARELIEKEITKDSDLNTDKSHYRSVTHCSEKGFVVKIGRRDRSSIIIPWEMLETCFNESLGSGGKYDGAHFRRCYSRQARIHPCYVHVIGQIFVKAGVALARRRNSTYTCDYYEVGYDTK